MDHRKKKENDKRQRRPCNNAVVLVFDTETTRDVYQNLLFGSCGVWRNEKLDDYYVFYEDDLDGDSVSLIKKYAADHGYTALGKTAFVDRVFYPVVYDEGGVCVGFNLPFDISRLSHRASYSSSLDNGFSFIMSKAAGRPRIAVKSIDSKRAFIRFMQTLRKKSDRKRTFNRGCFVDLKTACFALTNESHSLESAAGDFGCEHHKTHPSELGIVNEENLDYNVNDVLTTHELYRKVLERYSIYGLSKGLNEIYSPAGIGKAYLDKMGVRPFMEKNPDFPKEVLGYMMTSYYGGRSEVRIRRTPIRVAYLDFTSMYPTTYALYNLDRYLKAEKIVPEDSTTAVQRLLNKVTLEDVRKKEFWPDMLSICLIRPDDDILPVRSNYGEGGAYTIGLNHVKSKDVRLWYTLPDLIASKFLTGKTPIIERAISFRAVGVQDGLNDIDILPGIIVARDEDFIKKLIEERIELKMRMKSAVGEEAHQLDVQQNILKIIANSTSYGIYIEVNPQKKQDEPVTVYGLETFETLVDKVEQDGQAFNPVMALFLTAGSRLILATAEALVTKNGGDFAYTDTDSIFITPGLVGVVQDFFRPLNPYNKPMEMFKVEEDGEGKPLDDVWFYGISAKRYVLYDRGPTTGEIKIRKHSTHGLGGMIGFEKQR